MDDKSYSLLVNNPHGDQEIVVLRATGSYSLPDSVLWDERKDGPLPGGIYLGAMVRIKNTLAVDKNLLAASQQKAADQQAQAAKRVELNLGQQKTISDVLQKMQSSSASLQDIQAFLLAMHN